MPKPNSYAGFSNIYDAAIDPSMDFLEFFASKIGHKRLKILELGCGTGKHTIRLACEGHELTGLDRAPEMLKKAKKKAKSEGLKISWIQGNIEDFDGREEFDVVVSCDVLYHFLELSGLRKAFVAAFKSLKPGGEFFFQMYTKKYFENVSRELPYGGRVGKNFFIWENETSSDLLEITVSVFSPAKNGLFELNEVVVLERAYSKEEIKSSLKKAGFKGIKISSAKAGVAGFSGEQLLIQARKSV